MVTKNFYITYPNIVTIKSINIVITTIIEIIFITFELNLLNTLFNTGWTKYTNKKPPLANNEEFLNDILPFKLNLS